MPECHVSDSYSAKNYLIIRQMKQLCIKNGLSRLFLSSTYFETELLILGVTNAEAISSMAMLPDSSVDFLGLTLKNKEEL